MKVLSFWISGQVRYTHPAREVKDMKPQYLPTGKRRLMNHEQFEEKLDAMVGTIPRHNADWVRQSSRLVLPDVLAFRFKMCEFLPLVGREYRQLPTFLTKKTAIVNVQNNDNRCFGYAIASARASALGEVGQHVYRPENYNHLLGKSGLDQLNYPLEVADVPVIEDRLGIGATSTSSTTRGSGGTLSILRRRCMRGRSTCPTGTNTSHGLKTSCASWATYRATTPFTGAAAAWATGTEEVLKTHNLYCRGFDTTCQVLLLPDEIR